MSEETTTPEVSSTPEIPSFETAFILLKAEDGSWRATTDLTVPFQASRPASRAEIRQGCLEIADAIHQTVLVSTIMAALEQKSEEDSQRVSASVRDALTKRQSE